MKDSFIKSMSEEESRKYEKYLKDCRKYILIKKQKKEGQFVSFNI